MSLRVATRQLCHTGVGTLRRDASEGGGGDDQKQLAHEERGDEFHLHRPKVERGHGTEEQRWQRDLASEGADPAYGRVGEELVALHQVADDLHEGHVEHHLAQRR